MKDILIQSKNIYICNTSIWPEARLDHDDRLGELLVGLTKIELMA